MKLKYFCVIMLLAIALVAAGCKIPTTGQAFTAPGEGGYMTFINANPAQIGISITLTDETGAQQTAIEQYAGELGEGRYHVVYSKAGYQTVEQDISIPGDCDMELGISGECRFLADLQSLTGVGQLNINVNPLSAEVFLDDVPVPQAEGRMRYVKNVPGGPHTLRASHPAYQEGTQIVTVVRDTENPVTVSLTPVSTYVLVNPCVGTCAANQQNRALTGVNVFVDGVKKGVTPLTLTDVPAGEHTFKWELDGFHTVEKPVLVTLGEYRMTESLQKKAAVSITSNPSGATVKLTGYIWDTERDTGMPKTNHAVGQTPLTLTLLTGPYTFAFEKSGYQQKTTQVTLVAGQNNVDAQLQAATQGVLKVTSTPSGGTVYINNQLQSTPTTLSATKDVGTYQVKVVRDGFMETRTSSAVVTAGQTKTVTATFSQKAITVKVIDGGDSNQPGVPGVAVKLRKGSITKTGTTDANGRVSINVGTTPVGTYNIELIKSGYVNDNSLPSITVPTSSTPEQRTITLSMRKNV